MTENEFKKWLNIYFDVFGENYPILPVDSQTDEEIINNIQKCIETNIPAKEYEYEDGCDY